MGKRGQEEKECKELKGKKLYQYKYSIGGSGIFDRRNTIKRPNFKKMMKDFKG